MGFLGVYSAVFDYQPQGEGELEIREGDLLYVLEKSAEDAWWKAKKKADPEDDDEPEGLVPNNYVEEAQPTYNAKALYDYTRQTDEEVSFSEDAELLVYDTSDPDWTLVGVNAEFGFAPSNYIELIEEIASHGGAAAAAPPPPPAEPKAPSLPQRPTAPQEEEYQASPAPSPVHNPAAAAIADIIHKQHAPAATYSEPAREECPPPQLPTRPSHDQDREAPRPSLPQRPPSEQLQFSTPMEPYSPEPEPSRPPRPLVASPPMRDMRDKTHVKESPPYNRAGELTPKSPSGYKMYNINEMVEVMGKRKKMPTTIGINMVTGIIFISPEGDDNQQEWTAEKLTHYSIEGKHVFVDLVRPSKSIDFHAGAKDTASEIVAALGEIAGAYKAEGLREVLAAGKGGGGKKKGQILYDFMAQGEDEVTVAVGDEVVVIDDTKSEEWWMVKRLKNGKEGVVPSSYVEVTGFVTQDTPVLVDSSGLSSVEKNRLEESRLVKAVMGKTRTDSMDSSEKQHRKRDSKSSSKSKPDSNKVRKWTDRTKAFTVEAQFIGLQDGKIHLHKTNGIKIAVPVAKMSVEDLEYVEKAAGVSLDEDKPLSSIRARATSDPKGAAGASVQRPEYDWFDFFLKSGVGPHQCERYAQNFLKDSMDESVLPDISPETLRSLGLKEGDILRVMRHLDATLGRTGSKSSKLRNVSFGGEEVIGNGDEGGLFAGPGGMLRNNTRKGRPAPTLQAGDVVDPKAFEQADGSKPKEKERAASPPTPVAPSAPEKPVQRGFDDDAWEVKQPKQSTTSAPAARVASPTAAPAPVQKQVTGAMADLTLLQAPLQPTPAPAPAPTVSIPAIQPQQTAVQSPPPQQPQATGATPDLFAQVAQLGQQARARPHAPQNMNQNSLLPPPPPPQRPLSAPQNFSQQQNSFGPPPLQAQLTGIPQAGQLVGPPGQNFQPQMPQMPQQTGFMGQGQGQFQNGLMPQPTGFTPQSQFGIQQQQQQQPYGNGQPGFQGVAPQPTGFGGFAQPQQPMQTGINSVLPPALQPHPTGMNGFGNANNYNQTPPPVPPIPQQPTAAPLSAQPTGPPPSIRFGVKPDAPPPRLAPQPTGLRANLSQATPNNPFGF